MSNIEILEKLRLGTDAITQVEIELDNEKVTLDMRPLTDGELSKLKVKEQKAVDVKIKFTQNEAKNKKGMRQKTKKELEENKGETRLNSAAVVDDQLEVKYEAIALSLSVNGETVVNDDIKSMPSGLPDKLFEKVIEVSNLDEDSLNSVKNFL